MRYEIESIPVGRFASKLEHSWFLYFTRNKRDFEYVGDADRWRDFILDGKSVEVKPWVARELQDELVQRVLDRIPRDVSSLILVLGEPGFLEVFKLARAGLWAWESERLSSSDL